MNIGEFFVKLGINTDFKKIDKFNKAVLNETKNLGLMTAAAAAALYATDRIIDSVVQGVVALRNFNSQTDLSIAKLQKWQTSGVLTDVTLDINGIANSISGLQQSLEDIKLGGGNVAPFQLLGISVAGKDAFEVLEAIRESIKGLDNAKATNLIKKIGLDPRFINILRLSRQEFEKLGKMKFLSKKQRDDVLKLGTAIAKFKLEARLLKDDLLSQITPQIMKMLNMFRDMFSFIVFGIKDISRFKSSILALKIAFVALALAFAPITTGLTALLLIMQDVYTYTKGGKSVTGSVIDFFKKFGSGFGDISKGVIRKNEKLAEGKGFFEFAYDQLKQGVSKGFGFGGKKPNNNTNNNDNKTSFNNIFNIHSAESAREVAQQVVDIQTREFQYAYADVGSGARS